jgi:hypothetical protein
VRQTALSYICFTECEEGKGGDVMVRKVWGVDSAAPVTEELFQCVRSTFGYPKFWGRYLTDVADVSTGLTKNEIAYIRGLGIKILPVYNVITEAVGYFRGQVAARNAVYHARRLGIPENNAIFVNIEKFFNVDEAWIRGWVESLYPSGYRPGIYHDPVSGDFSAAYCEAVKNNNQVAVQSILWSAKPLAGISSERDAPQFKPAMPDCKGNVWVWQYGRDAKECPIDTNLADQKVLSFLY